MGALIVQIAGSLLPGLRVDDVPYPPELHLAKIWPRTRDSEALPQDHVMNHDTLVGFTKMLYNVIGHIAGGTPPAR